MPPAEPPARAGAVAQSLRARSVADDRDRAPVAARRPLGSAPRHRGLAPPRRHAALARAGAGGPAHTIVCLVEPAAFLDRDRGAAGAPAPDLRPRAGGEPQEGPAFRRAPRDTGCRPGHTPWGAGGAGPVRRPAHPRPRARRPVAALARAARPSDGHRARAPGPGRDRGGARSRAGRRDRARGRGCALHRVRRARCRRRSTA